MNSVLQHRGALHAHILLWLDAQSLQDVQKQITATRCKYKPVTLDDGSTDYVPDLPSGDCEARRLFQLVERKQIHYCRTDSHGCKHNSHVCKYGFPFAANREGLTFEESSNR